MAGQAMSRRASSKSHGGLQASGWLTEVQSRSETTLLLERTTVNQVGKPGKPGGNHHTRAPTAGIPHTVETAAERGVWVSGTLPEVLGSTAGVQSTDDVALSPSPPIGSNRET